jgi:hypothetical protein
MKSFQIWPMGEGVFINSMHRYRTELMNAKNSHFIKKEKAITVLKDCRMLWRC